MDRQFGERILAAFPLVRPIAKANRLFLQRAVRRLMRLGVEQFVDIGSGVPTMGNTYAVADEYSPGSARVVHVDNDPATVDHARELIERSGDRIRHAVVLADLREPDRLWQRVAETGVVDLSAPVALLLIAVLHLRQLDDAGVDSAPRVVARCRELLATGSYLAISHATKEGVPDEVRARLAGIGRMYDTHASPGVWRTRGEIADLFGDFELVDPGLTWTPLWRPEQTARDTPDLTFDSPNESVLLAGVARKP